METADEHHRRLIDVNMDVVAYCYPGKDHSTIYFAVADAGKLLSLSIKETIDAQSGKARQLQFAPSLS